LGRGGLFGRKRGARNRREKFETRTAPYTWNSEEKTRNFLSKGAPSAEGTGAELLLAEQKKAGRGEEGRGTKGR